MTTNVSPLPIKTTTDDRERQILEQLMAQAKERIEDLDRDLRKDHR